MFVYYIIINTKNFIGTFNIWHINQVMKDQADLVEVVTELRQVMCIKG